MTAANSGPADAFRAVHLPIRWVLISGIALMAVLHAVVTWAPPGTYSPALVDMVNVDREHNIPTWFSSAEILVLALSFFALAFHESRTRRRRLALVFWLACGAVALFLSMDETAQIHEALGDVAGATFRSAEVGTLTYYLSTFPSYYWALVYVPVAAPAFVVFAWFAIKELVGNRALAILGLVVYFSGALVLDHLEGHYGSPQHERLLWTVVDHTFRFDIFLLEELFEMVGVFLVLEAMLRHLGSLLRSGAAAPVTPAAKA